ncbi:hypothetical protein COCNU_contig69321417G000010 [Cocos nucifera]|nr:hypothetical protein [Cocos nucifera]
MSTSTMISLALLRTSGHLYFSASRSLCSPSSLPHLKPVVGSTKKTYQGPPTLMFLSTKGIDLPPDIQPPPGVDPPPLGTPVPRPGPDFPRPPIPSPPKPDIPLPPPDVLPRQPPPEVDPPTPPPPPRKPPGSAM